MPRTDRSCTLLLPAAALLLGACVANAPAAGGGDRPVSATPVRPGGCVATEARRFVGREATEAVLAELRTAAGAKVTRVYGPGMAVTMDFDDDRLTVEVDGRNRIIRVGCN